MTDLSVLQIALTLTTALLAGIMIAFTYSKTTPTPSKSQNFTTTLIILPIVIAVIILLIGSNVARAFSLAGAFSIIRFRSAPGNPKDIAFVLFTMAAGLSVGVGAWVYALIITVVLCIILWLIEKFKSHSTVETLLVTIPEDLDFEVAFKDTFAEFTNFCSLKQVKMTSMGSLFQLTYDVSLKSSASKKQLIDALRIFNSNLNIALFSEVDYNGK